MVKLFKTKFLLILMSCLLGLSAYANDRLQHKVLPDGRILTLDYDRQHKRLILEIKRDEGQRATISENFDVVQPGEMDVQIARANTIMSSNGVTEDTRNSILNSFEEFKMVSTVNCQAIHLGEELTADTRAIQDLIREFDRISAGIRGDGEFERSVEVFAAEVPGKGKFQLRALIDSNGKVVKLSLAQDGGTLKDFKVVRNGDIFTLSTSEGEHVLTIKNHNMENQLVSVAVHDRDALESVTRTHFKLETVDNNLRSSVIASSQIGEERVGSVNLTTGSVSHRPVVRYGDMDIFIPTFEASTLRERVGVGSFGDLAVSNARFGAQASSRYDTCIGEAFVLRVELSTEASDEELIRQCLGKVTLEFADQSLQVDVNKQTQFRACLQRIGAIKEQGEERLFVDDFFLTQNRPNDKLLSCERELKENEVITAFASLLQSQPVFQNPSLAPLVSGVRESVIQSYRLCHGSNCVEKAIKKGRHELYKVRFLSWFESASSNTEQRDRLVAAYDVCVEDDSEEVCQKDLIEKVVPTIGDQMYRQIAKESGLGVVGASRDENSAINTCVKDNLNRIAAGDLDTLDEWRYRCSFEEFKGNLPRHIKEYWQKNLSPYGLTEAPASLIEEIQVNLGQVQNAQDAKKLLDQTSATAYGAAFDAFVQNRMNRDLAPGSDQTEAARAYVSESLSAMTSPGSYDLNQSGRAFLTRQATQRGQRGVVTGFNDLVMRSHTLTQNQSSNIQLSSSFDGEELESQHEELVASYQNCWSSFDANGDEDALAHGVVCDKKSLAQERYAVIAKQMRDLVSRRYPLATQEASDILTPLVYMDKCFIDGDQSAQSSYEEYRKWIDACVAVTQIDIASNLYEKLTKKYTPIVGNVDAKKLEEKIACLQAPIKSLAKNHSENWLEEQFAAPEGIENSRPVEKIMAASDALVGTGSLLSAMFEDENPNTTFKQGDRVVLRGYLNGLASGEDIDFTQLNDAIENCEKEFDSNLSKGFQAYLKSSIPNLYQELVQKNALYEDSPFSFIPNTFKKIQNTINEQMAKSQQSVLEDVIDEELAGLLIALQGKSEYRVIESDAPGGTVVTSDFTVQALARFVEGMGQYIGRGFVFDMNEMKTELVIFKEELKDALRWVVESDEPVPLEELGQFFSESKLADHMALAHVAKNTNDNIHAFLSSMYDKEVAAFWERVKDSNSGFFSWVIGRDEKHLSKKQKTELAGIHSKFSELKSLSTNMTQSYDFRRIFNTYSEKGREALDYIKKLDFLPRLEGRAPSSVNQMVIDYAVADRLLADNKAGGFVDVFVKQVAQEYLDKRSRNKWGITKWMFYDDGDFNWDVLRETKSGQKALEYYGRYVLMPKMLGRQLSNYQENLHKDKFEELLREAQSEN